MNELTKVFDGQQVRIVEKENEPWFISKDVAEILGYRMASDLNRRLEDDEKGTHFMQTPGGKQNFTVINESGLYTAIFHSSKDEARKFKRWVTSEVLPSIRKQGMYMTNTLAQEISENPEIIHYLAEQVAKINTSNNKHHEETNNKLETIDKKIEGEYASPQDIDAIKYATKIKAEKFLESAGMQITLDNFLEEDIYEQAKISKRQKEQYRHDLGRLKSKILVRTKKQLGMKGNDPNNHIRRKDVDIAVQIIKDTHRSDVSA